MKILSFIVPSFNSEKTIKRCIESILRVATIDTEVVIVDNNSNDSTYEIEKKLCRENDKIKLFKENKKGVSNARNRGIKESSGKYCWFIDSDDEIILNKKKIIKLIEFLSTNNDNTVIMEYEVVNNGNIKIVKNVEKEYSKKEFYENFENIFIKSEFNVLWNKIYSKRIINNADLYFNNHYISGEDAIFNYNYFSNIKHVYVKKNIAYKYYVDSNQSKNFSNVRMKRIFKNDFERISALNEFYIKNGIKTIYNLIEYEKINCCLGEYENAYRNSLNYNQYKKYIKDNSIKNSIVFHNFRFNKKQNLKLIFIKFPLLSYIFFNLRKGKNDHC